MRTDFDLMKHGLFDAKHHGRFIACVAAASDVCGIDAAHQCDGM
jgi:hypothetical protein